MAKTSINLDLQADAQVFPFGNTSAGGEALVTLNKGTAAVTTVVLDAKGSINIAGDLNLTGNLNITGSIDEQSVTNLAVTDITVTLNKGGTTSGGAGAGLLVEGTSGAVVAAIKFDNTLASKFSIGNGTIQSEIVDVSSAQTLTNKSLTGSQISGNITGNAANVTGTVAVANGGTGAASLTGVVIGNGTNAFTVKANPTGAFVGDTDTQTLSAKTLTNPRIGQINDAINNLAVLLLVAPVSSVNQMTHTSAIAGAVPKLSATGTDTNISLNLVTKGSGVVQANGVEVVTLTGTQTLTNKTIAGSQITGNISGNAGNVSGIVLVPNGGTGIVTTTAFGVMHAGTTATGAFQNSGTPGTANTVYTSNGPTALPTWQTVTATSSFRATAVSGTQDASNKIFTIANAVSAGSELVTKNGQVLTPGSSNDYVISGTTVTFQAAFPAPKSTDVIRVYGNY